MSPPPGGAVFALLAGGLGLFLLGMSMMTDGLKLVAGPALQRILGASTRTRWHALGSGMLVTALVQSSSAVTVAAIGFVNVGLLGLAPALWVLFGANVGTTMTGWIVALVGLRFKVELLALPLVGAGMLLKLTGQGRRRGALGTTTAAFGLLFYGIALLQQAFGGLAGTVQLPPGEGLGALLAQLGAGALMTVLMRSSSASMAVALSAAQGGLIGMPAAAAVVIGANIGTTVTAVLASIGATPNARRAAAAHVAFNALTAVVALAVLPWMLSATGAAREALGLPDAPAAALALFHTGFNLLGVMLMWPLANALTRWLQRRFSAREDDEAQPRHLDDNVLAVPTLALEALEREIGRIGELARGLLRAVLSRGDGALLGRARQVIDRLDASVEAFVERMNRAAMPPEASRRLARLLRLQRYHDSCAEQALLAAPLPAPSADDTALAAAQAAFEQALQAWLAATDARDAHAAAEDAGAAMEAAYARLKAALLDSGAAGRIGMADMEAALRSSSALRRAGQQALKAARLARGAAA